MKTWNIPTTFVILVLCISWNFRCRMYEMCRTQYPDELCQQSKNGIKCTIWKKAPSVHLENMNNHTSISNKNGKLNGLKNWKKKQKYPSKTNATTNKQVLSDNNRPMNNKNLSKPNETKIIQTEKEGTVQAGNIHRLHLYDLIKRVMHKLINQTANETVLAVNSRLISSQTNPAPNFLPDANETKVVMETNPFPTATPNSHVLSVNEENQNASQPHQKLVKFIINSVVALDTSNSSTLTVETKKATDSQATLVSSFMTGMTNVVTGSSDDSQVFSPVSDGSQVMQTDAINVTSPKMYIRREISEKNVDCITTPCRNDGHCINKNGMTSCLCTELYEGKFCQDMVNQCKSNPCLNGGTCTSVGMYYICQCQSNFDGRNCEKTRQTCAHVPCKNGGSCVNLKGDYVCHCTPEYRGSRCEFTNPCIGVVCLNGNECTPTENGVNYTCTSLPPMKDMGLKGQKIPDSCHKQPCQNGGSCINDLCQCSSEYLGTRCELKKPCLSGVCPKDGEMVLAQHEVQRIIIPIVGIMCVPGVLLIFVCIKYGVPKFNYSRIEDSSKEEKSEKQNKGY